MGTGPGALLGVSHEDAGSGAPGRQASAAAAHDVLDGRRHEACQRRRERDRADLGQRARQQRHPVHQLPRARPDDRDTVIGRSEQGDVYLRVVPTRWLPRDTSNQLSRAITAAPPELTERYHEKAFTAAAYERPAATGADAYMEPVYLILEGPLASMGCNEVRTLHTAVLALRVCALT